MRTVSVIMYRTVLQRIVAECNKFSSEETGGALIGTFQLTPQHLEIKVEGVIGAGPNARRTAVSFFKDGEYQEKIFRQIEQQRPDINHLGSWHTHHPNGLMTLSFGDKDTYLRCVNSPNHSIPFWYEFLITDKKGPSAYGSKQFLLFAGDPWVYEIPASCMSLVDRQTLEVA